MKAQRYFLKLSYKGTHFFGWQIQPNAITVQEKLNEALQKLNRGTAVKTTGCGRTDTGVHASDFYVHFDLDINLDEETFKFKLNCMLPRSIAILAVYKVPSDLHARFSATSRTYHYFIHTEKNPFLEEESWLLPNFLNIEEMNRACELLLEQKNFKCFSKTITELSSFECDVTQAKWTKSETGYSFTITANRFLRNMVRAIVGTTVEVGKGNKTVADFQSILASQNRELAGKSAPAHGLFLTKVAYKNDESAFFYVEKT